MVQINIEILIAFITLFIPWVSWVSYTTWNTQARLRVIDGRHEDFKSQFEKTCQKLTDSFDEMKAEVKDDFEKINDRMDMFIKSEIDTLKQIAANK